MSTGIRGLSHATVAARLQRDWEITPTAVATHDLDDARRALSGYRP